MCQTVEVSVTHQVPSGHEEMWQLQSIFQEKYFSHRKRAICLFIKRFFFLNLDASTSCRVLLVYSHQSPKTTSQVFSLFGLGKSMEPFGHENIQPRKHLCKHLQHAREINLKTHKAGLHFQTHYFLVWRMPVNDK